MYADDVKLYSNIIANAFNATYDLQDQLELGRTVKMGDGLAPTHLILEMLCSAGRPSGWAVGRASLSSQQQSFVIGAHAIQSVSSAVDLGVTVNSNLKFSLHINETCSKANKRANLILCCFESELRVRRVCF